MHRIAKYLHSSLPSRFNESGTDFLVAVLELIKLVVEAAFGEELLMGALFAQRALVHDQDRIR